MSEREKAAGERARQEAERLRAKLCPVVGIATGDEEPSRSICTAPVEQLATELEPLFAVVEAAKELRERSRWLLKIAGSVNEDTEDRKLRIAACDKASDAVDIFDAALTRLKSVEAGRGGEGR